MTGMHSTLFGPVKYAYLPQHLNEHEIVGGNGMVEMGSIVAILLGQVVGAWLAMQNTHAALTSITVLGIGIGSLMCEKLSKGKVELGLVLFGASGLTLFSLDLYYASASIYESLNNKAIFDYTAFIAKQYDAQGHLILSHWRLLLDIAFIGIFGGLYIVPLYAFI